MEKVNVKVLCVDDEPQLLAGLALQLRHGYDVWRATSGPAGLEAIRDHGPFAVILSDMQMPGMDGSVFLAHARELSPDSTRMLLTGQADLDSAIAAVNRGQIFRFLTKPCPPEVLRLAFDAATEQHRLVTAQKVLLEQTLVGSIQTLSEILSISSPLLFGRARRVRELCQQLADHLGVKKSWALDAAAQLLHLSSITLPPETAHRYYYGEELDPREKEMVARLGATNESLLAHIPRLEPVREILQRVFGPRRLDASTVHAEPGPAFEAEILRVVREFDELEARGLEPRMALDTLAGRHGRYDLKILAALEELKGAGSPRRDIREVPVRLLSPGMEFVEDVFNSSGMLIVAKGHAVSATFLERMRNYPPGYVKEPLRVILPQTR